MSTLTPAKWVAKHSGEGVLRTRLNEALDLLDELIDPLLDIGVCKGRVQSWKDMVRKEILG